MGMFSVLDRLDRTGISQEDIRRARAFAAQVAVVLEVARNLHQSEQHRRRSEILIQLAREIGSLLHLPDFSRKFVQRAVELTGRERRSISDGAGRAISDCRAAPTSRSSPAFLELAEASRNRKKW